MDEQDTKDKETSFKQLTVSSTPSEGSTTTERDPAVLKKYAAERSRLLFGCYRKGDANDPDTYVAAITAVLSRYPHDVIRDVTHPAKGLPIRCDFLPTVKEVYDACEERVSPRREDAARKKRVEKQLAERGETEPRPVYSIDSPEAKAIRVLHDIVGRTSAFFTIFRRGDGSVTYTKPVTEQLAALAQAPPSEAWVSLSRQQAGAWDGKGGFLSKFFDHGLVRLHLVEGSRAPWPWPPSIDGKLYPAGDDPPLMTEQDLQEDFK
jgi:hypothetical protein